MIRKNVLLLYAIITILIIPAHAQEDFKVIFNIGNFGFGVNVPFNDVVSIEGTMELLNIGIEYQPQNIGLEFSPFKGFLWMGTGPEGANSSSDDTMAGFSLANFRLYWNVVNYDFFYLGPFASINYVFVDDRVHWNNYILTAGAQIGLRGSFSRMNYNMLSGELGYRIINGRPKYYMGIKIDMLVFFFFSSAASHNHY